MNAASNLFIDTNIILLTGNIKDASLDNMKARVLVQIARWVFVRQSGQTLPRSGAILYAKANKKAGSVVACLIGMKKGKLREGTGLSL